MAEAAVANGTPAALDAVGASPGIDVGRSWVRRYPASSLSVRDARHWVRDLLSGTHLPYEPAVVELAVSELVGNAVRHGSGGVVVKLGEVESPAGVADDTDGRLRVEVSNACPLADATPRATVADLDAVSGRGLFLVAADAADWGTARTPDGTITVWCEFAPATGA